MQEEITVENRIHAVKLIARNILKANKFHPEIDESAGWGDLQMTWTTETFLQLVSIIPTLGQQLEMNDVKLEIGRVQKIPIAGHNIKKKQVTLHYMNIHPKIRRKGFFSVLIRYLLVKHGAIQIESVQNKYLVLHLFASDKWSSNFTNGSFLLQSNNHGRILTADELKAIAEVDVSDCDNDHDRYCKQINIVSLW
jgi:hypothetical protein